MHKDNLESIYTLYGSEIGFRNCIDMFKARIESEMLIMREAYFAK